MNGFINVNKPKDWTSRDVVNRVSHKLRRRFGRRIKVGHCGTLDPLATGVLVVAVGSATRLVTRVQDQPKSYIGRFLLGSRTNTDDITGEIIESSSTEGLHEDSIVRLLPEFSGEIEQTPPQYSAVKVNGKRAYKLARRGKSVAVKPRPVTIHSIDLTDFAHPEFELSIHCGSGTYIRSIGRDIGVKLKCGATMTELRRTQVGRFRLDDAHEVDALYHEEIAEKLQPSYLAVPELPRLQIASSESERLRNGRPIDVRSRLNDIAISESSSPQQIVLMNEDEFVCIARVDEEYAAHPALVFPATE